MFQDCYDFTSLHSVIGPERNSHYSLDQSDGKLKPIPPLLRVFPRFKQVACVYFEFPLVNEDVNLFLLIGSSDNFGFGSSKLN